MSHRLPPGRIGLVSFVNAAPLAEGLPPDAVRRGLPADVADWLATGEVDVALLPVVELGRMPGVTAWSRWGVAGDGRCESVLLFASTRLPDVRTVALDAASRTSSALARVILDREGARDVTYTRLTGGTVEERLAEADATVLIGDPALGATCPAGVTRWDLATEWKRHVGLPFVFALWATRAGHAFDDDLRRTLGEAAARGLDRLPEIAAREGLRTGLPAARLTSYLRQLDYSLGPQHLLGLRAFLDEVHRLGILERRADVAFVE